MVLIPAGREVHAFYMDRTEVTAGMYTVCVDSGACTPRQIANPACNDGPGRARHPMNCVDRAQAMAYCAHAGKRLPADEEWEYAARGPEGRRYPWGDNAPTTCTMAILRGLSGECRDRMGTGEIAQTPDGRSPTGLYDMAGNVREWVDGDAPDGSGILRGGGWEDAVDAAQATTKSASPPGAASPSSGFRCARSAD
jgi:formylglycine-generating enzyme required for sulfatase activity